MREQYKRRRKKAKTAAQEGKNRRQKGESAIRTDAVL